MCIVTQENNPLYSRHYRTDSQPVAVDVDEHLEATIQNKTFWDKDRWNGHCSGYNTNTAWLYYRRKMVGTDWQCKWWSHYLQFIPAGKYSGKMVRGEAQGMHHQAVSVSFRNVHCGWSYECSPKTGNFRDRGIMLHGRCEVRQRATLAMSQWLSK